jgi:segregation and condensation protein A
MILDSLGQGGEICFSDLFVAEEGRSGAVVAFLAILELCKEGLIDIVQSAPLSGLHVKIA